ncbi:carbohydrate ABC transporter permease [Fervidibacillus halotolerans]|uniref:Sugar ABC transporter permease n=1 Tax=Fervidibacillus halotolerans TaxID=2980027 RepID=A0A9E8S033_9BACI|nr:sugar ABC transporter permease [Fervidibacillus halotolerans]WAA12227.1 sugar ABC transporter permease [Fervidibacillus halotolerans]
MKKMGWKGSLFILPTLILIAIFSLWPVIQSFTYTFFDYRLNNQQKSGLYLNQRFNTDLFNETSFYVTMFLEEDLPNITDAEDQESAQVMIDQIHEVSAQYADLEGVIKISDQQREEIVHLHDEATNLISEFNEKYTLINGENLVLLIDDFQNSIIPSNFIGLKSYKDAITDKRVHTALWNTVFFTVVSVFFEFIFGLALALILNKAISGQGLIRATSLIPWAIPTAVAALMWGYLYDGSFGVVAAFFEKIGLIENSTDLLQSASGAMFATILADVWKTTPYMALLLLAGLQTIPSSLYEAGAIDGAGKIQSFFRITLPLLKPSILVALLFRTLDAFRVFDLIFVLTNGGPGGSTETLSIYAYKAMFGQTNFGYGSVIVMIMFVCVAIIAIIFVKFLGANLMEKN